MCGPTLLDTTQSIDATNHNVQSAFMLQSAAIHANLNNNCDIFDEHNLCVAAGAQYFSAGNSSQKNATGIVGYKVNDNIHVGAYLSQNFTNHISNGIGIESHRPSYGAYVEWTEKDDGVGLKAKISSGYQAQDISIQRDMSFGSNFSHYSGDSQINTFGLQSILSYGVLVDNKWLVSPYVGLTYVKISLDGYTEKFIDGNYTPVANYGNVNDRSENILLGLKLKGKLSPKLDALMDFGIEKDINRSNENYSANGFYSFLIPFNYAVPLNSDFQKNRIFASLGVIYEITENQHLSFNANYRQEQFQSSHSAASGLVYKISF